jgi:hypothetical protein
MKLTIKKAVNMFNAISNMKQGGVSVKGLKNIDLAMNKKSLEPIVDGYTIAMTEPEGYKKFAEQINDLSIKYNNLTGSKSDKAYVELSKLKKDFAKEITEYEAWKESVKNLPNEEKEITIIMLKKNDFSFDDNNSLAPEIMYGLLPCIED